MIKNQTPGIFTRTGISRFILPVNEYKADSLTLNAKDHKTEAYSFHPIRADDVINPSSLSGEEKDRFADALYQLHSRIFDGVTKARFVSYVIDSPADWTRIRIYKNAENEWIGYCAAHRSEIRIFDRSRVIFRAEAGILREYRGRSKTLWFGFSEAIKYRIRHPLCDLYYLGSFVHPSVLYMFSRYFSEYYPRADAPVPESIRIFMLELANAFHIEDADEPNELVRQVGWITKESREDRCFWQNNSHPVVKFYIKTNPGYVIGNGLLTLVPLTFSNTFFSLIKFINNKLTRRFSKQY